MSDNLLRSGSTKECILKRLKEERKKPLLDQKLYERYNYNSSIQTFTHTSLNKY